LVEKGKLVAQGKSAGRGRICFWVACRHAAISANDDKKKYRVETACWPGIIDCPDLSI
jgi:hypothetical protein